MGDGTKSAAEIARHYFDLSNQSKLSDISKLFTACSTYSSANTGMFLGADEIMKMQAEFFAGHQALNWTIDSLEEVKSGIVVIDFSFTGKTLNGEAVYRSGLETVVVYQGKIQHIEVKNNALAAS